MTWELFNQLVFAWIGIGLAVYVLLLFISAPYGRHTRKGWGPVIPNKLAWVIMELPSLIFFSSFFLFGPNKPPAIAWIFFGIWVLHYTNRAFVFPFRTRTKGKTMPLLIALFAVFFNLVNGSFNGYYFSAFANYTVEWLYDIRFILGGIVFITGLLLNNASDQILLQVLPDRSSSRIPPL